MSRLRETSSSVSIPAPIAGKRTDLPYDFMNPTDAIELKNVFPYTDGLRTRLGCELASTGAGSFAVESLHEFINETGNRKLLACANGGIYNASGTPAVLLQGGMTSNRWESVKYENILYLVNGYDAPKQYNGVALTDTAWTGVPDKNKLSHISSYKDRLYFCYRDSTDIYYATALLSTLALTVYPVGYYLSQGGHVLFTAQFSQETGDGNENQFIVVGSEGDVLLFRGDYPGGSWSLDKELIISRPLGKRSFVRVGADILILTEGGLLSLRKALSPDLEGNTDYVSKRVESDIRKYVFLYGDNFGWQIKKYSKRQILILNIPIREGNQATNPKSKQVVFNLESWGSADFDGWNASCFEILDGDLYMGTSNGEIYKCDSGLDDAGNQIDWVLQQAFVYPNDDRSSVKRFTAIEPVFKARSDTVINYALATDYEDAGNSYEIEINVNSVLWGVPWGSLWGDTDFTHKKIASAFGVGANVSFRFFGVVDSSQIEYTSTKIIFEIGGVV